MQKRLTRKWPTTLNGLPRHIKARKDYRAGSESERLNVVLKFYYQNFERLEVVRNDRKSYTCRLHLKDRVVVCVSTVRPDDGYCTY